MKKHIMLLFLSDVKVKDGQIEAREYEGIGEAATTNESAVRYVLQQEEDATPIQLDKMFVFASKMIQNDIYMRGREKQRYHDADGHSWTHLGYFQHRLLDVLPRIESDDFLTAVSYDEEADIHTSRGTILTMAKEIMEYANLFNDTNSKPDPVVLHVDLTGGLRHANMLMLAVVRLLQYNGIEIGKILYSDYGRQKVEEANDIYNMFDLIAGAEEFVQFGSVRSILRYFGYDHQIPDRPPEISPELHDLLIAMNGFAEEIKLCHYGAFRAAIKQLRTALERFSQKGEGEGRFNDCLMGQLQIRVYEEYHDILATEEVDDIQLIDWCIKRDYLQQALTLYTERVPEIVIGKYHMLEPTAELRQEIGQEQEPLKDKRSPEFYLFSVYEDPEEKSQIDSCLSKNRLTAKKEMKRLLKEALAGNLTIGYDEFLQQLNLEKGHLWLQDPELLQMAYEKLQAWSQNPQLLMDDTQADTWQKQLQMACYRWQMDLWEKENPDLTSEALEKKWADGWKWGKQKRKLLVRFLDMMDIEKCQAKIFTDIVEDPRYWKTWAFRRLIDKKKIKCIVPVDDICQIRYYYSMLKDERNQSNHARMDNEAGGSKRVYNNLKAGVESLRKAIPKIVKK